jgi:hypothetical protein
MTAFAFEDCAGEPLTEMEIAEADLIAALEDARERVERPLLAMTDLVRAQARVAAAFSILAERMAPAV